MAERLRLVVEIVEEVKELSIYDLLRFDEFLGNYSVGLSGDQKVHTKLEKEGWGAGWASGERGSFGTRARTLKSNFVPFV